MARDLTACTESPSPLHVLYATGITILEHDLGEDCNDDNCTFSDSEATRVHSTNSDASEEYSPSLTDQDPTVDCSLGVTYLERLRSVALDDANLFDFLYPMELAEDVLLFKHRNLTYSLRPTLSSLSHQIYGTDTSSDFTCLAYRENKSAHEDLRFFAFQPVTPAQDCATYAGPSIFIRMGFLIEEGRSPEGTLLFRRRSNYALCWNVSTRPTSLWAVYDYCTMSPEGGISYNTLRDPGEDDFLKEQELQGLHDLIESHPFKGWDDELQSMQSVEEAQPCGLCHEIDEREEISDGIAEDAQAPQAVTIKDYDRISTVAHYGYQHAPFEPGHEEVWIPDHPIIPGLDSEWDVAMLCPDAQEWFTNHTLDIDRLTSCGHLNRFRLGNHLRAGHAKKTWVEEVAGGIFNKYE